MRGVFRLSFLSARKLAWVLFMLPAIYLGPFVGLSHSYNEAMVTAVTRTPAARGQVALEQASSQGNLFEPVTPFRIVDTRVGSGCAGISPSGPLQAGAVYSVQVVGASACEGTSGSVPQGSSAVALNVTVVSPSASGYLTLWPSGSPQPTISNLNFTAGQIAVSNMAIVELPASGSLDVYLSSGSANLVVDVEGYFFGAGSTNAAGYYYQGVSPFRICDTREGNPSGLSGQEAQCNGQELAPSTPMEVQVAGLGDVPASATAALISLTAVDPSAAGYESVFPASQTIPTVSNLNFSGGETIANQAIVSLSPSGAIDVVSNVATNTLVDVYGYFTAGSSGSVFFPVSPYRIVDTRPGSGCSGISPDTPLSPGGSSLIEAASALGCEGTTAGYVPQSPTGVVANLTLVRSTGQAVGDYLTATPNLPVPMASVLNVSKANPNTAIACQAVVGLASGDFYIYNNSGDPNIVVDIFGFFAPATGSGQASSMIPSVVESENWSGYVIQGGPFLAATGTFSVTQLVQGDQPSEGFAEWVGVGGFGSNDLIQAGIDEFVDPSNPSEYEIQPWWEILPSPQVDITTLQVYPGNQVTVTLEEESAQTWLIEVTNDSTGESFSTLQQYSGTSSSVDWVVEAPEVNSNQTELAQYSPPVEFDELGYSGNAGSLYEVVMVQGGVTVSTPSSIDATGFDVSYGSQAPPPPA